MFKEFVFSKNGSVNAETVEYWKDFCLAFSNTMNCKIFLMQMKQ
jgi:hypothetical protein